MKLFIHLSPDSEAEVSITVVEGDNLRQREPTGRELLTAAHQLNKALKVDAADCGVSTEGRLSHRA